MAYDIQNTNEIKTLIEQAEKGIENYFRDSESIKEYLDFKAKFYQYSLLNNILIQKQFPGAEAVGSYTFFKEKGFFVKRGENSIKIRAMCNYKTFENEKGETKLVSKATKEERNKIKSGEYRTFPGKSFCKIEHVFDISQTNATTEDLPKLFPNKWLEGKVKDYNLLYKGILNIAEKQHTTILAAPKSELGAAKGCCYPDTNEIALNPRNSELQNIKTLIHELAHAKLHTGENATEYAPYQKELQAEMTAYVVCQHYGIDTSDYSFKYMHDWVEGKSLNDKKKLLNEVSDTAKSFIKSIDEVIEKEFSLEELEEFSQNHETMLSEKEIKKKSPVINTFGKTGTGKKIGEHINQDVTDAKEIKKMLHKNNIENSHRLIKGIQKLNEKTGKFLETKDIQQMQKHPDLHKDANMEKLVNSICKDMKQLEMVVQH